MSMRRHAFDDGRCAPLEDLCQQAFGHAPVLLLNIGKKRPFAARFGSGGMHECVI